MYALVLYTVEPYTLLRPQARSSDHLWDSESRSDADELTHFRDIRLSNKLQIFVTIVYIDCFCTLQLRKHNLADYSHRACNRAALKYSEGNFKTVLVWDCMWSLVLCSVDYGMSLSARQTVYV